MCVFGVERGWGGGGVGVRGREWGGVLSPLSDTVADL